MKTDIAQTAATITTATAAGILEKLYREGYEDTALVVAPVAVPVGTYRMDGSNDAVDGAILVGGARLVPDGDAARGNLTTLVVDKPNTFAFSPYSDSQFFVTAISQEGDDLTVDGDEQVVNSYNGDVFRD